MPNIFDVKEEAPETFIEPQVETKKSSIAGFIAGTATLVLLAALAPIYIHILVEIAKWSWNLI